MGQQRSASGHRTSSQFDIKNFSFMNRPTVSSSRAKSQRLVNRKIIENFKGNVGTRQNSSLLQQQHESKPTDNLSAWLKNSYDKRRKSKAYEPELLPNEVSTKNGDGCRKVSKCCSAKKVDHTHKEHKRQKHEEDSRKCKYVDKSCSPILQLMARGNIGIADKVTGFCGGGRKKVSHCQEESNPMDNHRALQKIDESLIAGSPLSRDIPDAHVKHAQVSEDNNPGGNCTTTNVVKCANCGIPLTTTTTSDSIEELTEQLVQSVCDNYPNLVDVADSVRSLLCVPSPVVDMIKYQIISAMRKRNPNAEGRKHSSTDSVKKIKSIDVDCPADMLINSRKTKQYPYGVLDKEASPKNPQKDLHPPTNPPIKAPPNDWVSPLPHTPGFKKQQRVPRSISSQCEILQPQDGSSNCIEWCEDMEADEQGKLRPAGWKKSEKKYEIWCEDVTNEHGDRMQELSEDRLVEKKTRRTSHSRIRNVNEESQIPAKIPSVTRLPKKKQEYQAQIAVEIRSSLRAPTSKTDREDQCFQESALTSGSSNPGMAIPLQETSSEKKIVPELPKQKQTSPKLFPPSNVVQARTFSGASEKLSEGSKNPLQSSSMKGQVQSPILVQSQNTLCTTKEKNSKPPSCPIGPSHKSSSTTITNVKDQGSLSHTKPLTNVKENTEENTEVETINQSPESTQRKSEALIKPSKEESKEPRSIQQLIQSNKNLENAQKVIPFSQPSSVTIKETNQNSTSLINPAKHTTVSSEEVERERSIITDLQSTALCKSAYSEKKYGERSSRDFGRRVGFLPEGRNTVTRTQIALVKQVPYSRLNKQLGPATSIIPGRGRLIVPTRVAPRIHRRESIQRDSRNQIRMYKARNRRAHSLNPFFWFKKNTEKSDGQQTVAEKNNLSAVTRSTSNRYSKALVNYTKSSGPDLDLIPTRTKILSPSVTETTSVISTVSGPEAPTPQQLDGHHMTIKTTSPKQQSNDWKMTRAQMFRSQFIQDKIHSVDNYDDSWWKNFNSQLLPGFKKADGSRSRFNNFNH